MEDFESYITTREAASRLNRTEDEIWRMLETGKLPAILRAELQSKDGSSLGFDYALLPPEGVARVLHQGGSDLVLKWKYAFGNGAATCVSAKPESIRILWEPHLLSDVLGSNVEPGQAARDVAPKPRKKRKAWRDVAWEYVVQVQREGRYRTCKELFNALERKGSEPGTPIIKGTGDQHRGRLYVVELRNSFELKTFRNAWPKIREAAVGE